MTQYEIQPLMDEADSLLASAESELMRAEEDIVTHMVCNHSRQSIMNYMKGFLYSNNQEPQEPCTLQSLKHQCLGIDEKFDDLDFSDLDCRFEIAPESYCYSVEKVEKCVAIARKARDLSRS